MKKLELRQHIRRLRTAHSPEQLAKMSELTIRLLEAHPLFRQARCVLLYHSLPDEVDTHFLIEKLIQAHDDLPAKPHDDCTCSQKEIYLPTVVGDRLDIHALSSHEPCQGATAGTALRPGAFGIMEATGPLLTAYSQLDLAVIPGVAFDRQGHRLGRGRGYYDRLLPLLSCPCIGICFPFQIVDNLPLEPHDQRVQDLVFLPKSESM